jgi:Trk K+ transport system NAD-binding subunit
MANADAYPMGIAGAGRVAQALGRVLAESGQRVVAVPGRDPERTAQAARFKGARAVR